MSAWQEVGRGVYRRRYSSFDLNVGLVLGDCEALLVDTRGSEREGRVLRDEIAALTRLPVRTVVNTHAHFDHCFGNAVFDDATVWGHENCRANLLAHGELQRRLVLAHMNEQAPDDLATSHIMPPQRTFADRHDLDIGGRLVQVAFLGKGHTDNDVVVAVPDAGVVFAGDLVENGAPPAFGDAWPLLWPMTVGRLESLIDGVVVPGHGDTVDASFLTAQREELTAVARLVRAVLNGERDASSVAASGPYPSEVMAQAVARGRDTSTGTDRRVLPDGGDGEAAELGG